LASGTVDRFYNVAADNGEGGEGQTGRTKLSIIAALGGRMTRGPA